MKIKSLIVAIGLSISAFTLNAQKSFQGKIVYEINYEEVPEMLEPYLDMLPKEATTYVKDEKTRVEQSTMGVVSVNVTDSKNKTGFLLMDQFGEKSAYEMTENDMKRSQTNPIENFDVNYTNETKEIAGFTCTKVEIKDKKDGNVVNVWITKNIKAKSQTYTFIDGFPLEYTVKANSMTITMKTKSIDKAKVSDDYFKIPNEYTKKPYKELLDKMEQMKGMNGDE